MPDTLRRWTHAVLLCTLGTASATPFLPSSTVAAQAVREALGTEAPAAVRSAPQPAVQAASAPAVKPVAVQPAAKSAAVKPARVSPPAARPAVAVAKAPVARAAAPVARTPVAQTAVARKAAPAKPVSALSAAQVRAQGVALAQGQAVQARSGRSVIARATAYNSMPGQTDSTPFITATGTRTRPGVVALSRDLLRSFPYGSKIMIEDLSGRSGNLLSGRVFYVEDTMAARKTGSVDIWMASYGQAIRFGARQVRITAVR